MSVKKEVKSVQEMRSLASRVARDIKVGDILLLKGPLGSGKTTFVQGLARALGVREQVTSPSFTVVTEYEVGGRAGLKLVHLDLYRLSEEEADREAAVKEMLDSADKGDRVTVVEWADRLGGFSPKGAWQLVFLHGDRVSERIVKIINPKR